VPAAPRRSREENNCRTDIGLGVVADGYLRAGPLKEAMMEEYFVWMTTRQIRPGTLADFERSWRPDTRAEGMLRAYAYWSEDEREIVGISFWASRQSCEAWRASAGEARRREAMAAYVVGEQEAFYRGRELVMSAQ
jgi:heme-degrading monooxygenase HmoA